MDFRSLFDPNLASFWARFWLHFGSIFGPPSGGHFERKHKEIKGFLAFPGAPNVYFSGPRSPWCNPETESPWNMESTWASGTVGAKIGKSSNPMATPKTVEIHAFHGILVRPKGRIQILIKPYVLLYF